MNRYKVQLPICYDILIIYKYFFSRWGWVQLYLRTHADLIHQCLFVRRHFQKDVITFQVVKMLLFYKFKYFLVYYKRLMFRNIYLNHFFIHSTLYFFRFSFYSCFSIHKFLKKVAYISSFLHWNIERCWRSLTIHTHTASWVWR